MKEDKGTSALWKLPVARALQSMWAAVIAPTGCATTVSVEPQLRGPSPTCQIRAPISYDGKPDYLPSALLPAKEASQAVVRYSYDAQYGLDQLPAPIAIVNPWMLAGFPSGSNAVVVTARLDVVREGAAVRSYAAAAALKRTATIFSEGETLTAMRHRA